MLEFESDKQLPELHHTSLAVCVTEGIQKAESTLWEIEEEARRIEKNDTPSEIAGALEQEKKLTLGLLETYKELEFQAVASSESENKRSPEVKKELDKLRSTLDMWQRTVDEGNDRWEATEMFQALLSAVFKGDPDYIEDRIRGHSTSLKNARTEYNQKEKEYNQITNGTALDGKVVQNNLTERLFLPIIYSYRAEHGLKTYHDVEHYAGAHHTDANDMMMYLRHSSPECAMSFAALLKANYSMNDLHNLYDYAKNAKITDAPEQRALLQFINHSLVPHIDYFEIWASKMHDLFTLKDEIITSLKERKVDNIPRLEILGQKSIKLSGKIAEKTPLEARTPKSIEALTLGSKHENDARDQVKTLIADLNDYDKGDLKQRHHAVKLRALKEIEKFNTFFGGVEGALKHIDASVNNATGQRARAWQTFMSAEVVHNQIELANFNSPENIRKFNRKVLWHTTIANAVGLDVTTPGQALGGWIRNYDIEMRGREEFEIRMKSLVARQSGDPEELRKAVDELDKEIEKLAGDKEFYTFLSKNGAVENVRSVYMLLTRLVAGESNIDALELYTKASGYTKIDDFIVDLNTTNVRLGRAMEKFASGFADSNDLEVIIAESNAIKNPKTPKQKALLEYVEEIIKPHFSDMSRQASIVDHLQMRNALYTGHRFHSFGEVVKKETDAALRALLSGKGDFTLVGSNDIHQLFGFHLARHGEETFIDLHNRNIRKPKLMELSPNNELQVKNKEVASARDENTVIPRLSNVFVEICTHEYLLSQGVNIVKDKRLAAAPETLGAMEMVNETVKAFVQKLAMDEACRNLASGKKNLDGTPKGYERIGKLAEGLIADSCIQYFSQLGATHYHDNTVQDKLKMVKNAYKGENFALPHSLYTKTITGNAIAPEGFEMFLNIYQQNLEKYLNVATRENKTMLLDQLSQVKDIMKDIQLSEKTVLPDSEEARLRAHYRNHSLSNVSQDHSSWVMRTEAIHDGSKQIG